MTPGQLYYKTHKKTILANRKARRPRMSEESRERERARGRDWARRNPDLVRNKQLKTRYGITLVQWKRLFKKQGSCCALCKTDNPGKRDWATDHDHVTGVVRGILCHRCNLLLGWLGDNIKPASRMMKRIWTYLKRGGKKPADDNDILVPWEPPTRKAA